jgi:protein subunit release factor A
LEGRGVVPPALRTSTLRAEGYGGLAVNQAFASITQFNHVPTTKKPIQFIADNSSLIQQLINGQCFTGIQATKSTASEHEVIATIHNITCMSNNISYHHMKGHQRKKNWSEEAQLNQQCNKLATKARNLSKNVKATQFPSAKATIFINSV